MIQANGQAAQRFLGPPRTADYKPSLVAPLPLWSGHDTTWYSWFDVEWMRRDPQCQFGLRILRAPLATVTWEIPASAPEVAAWVDRTLRKVWTRYLNKVTAYLEYGSCGGEVTWRYDQASDLIELDELLDLHVLDMKPLQQRRKQVGIRVKSSLGDMAPADLFAPRYWWIANEPEFGAYHGRARLSGAWIPWQEKTARHGARDVRRTWYVKCVMDGGTLYVPPGTTEVDIGVNKANVDYGRELMEKSLAGGVKVFPNVTDEKGKRLWEHEAPKINGELTGIHTLMEELDIEIIVGMGIPPEVVQAADTGSGWSGRSVPFLVFLTSEDQLADTTVQAIDRHILRPGVAVNFGEDARYEIRLKSLVKQAEEQEAKKEGQAPGPTAAQGQEGGQQKPGPPQGQGQQQQARQPAPVRMSVQHAPAGYTKDNPLRIGGKEFVGGEFIPEDVLAKATKEEKAGLKEGKRTEKKTARENRQQRRMRGFARDERQARKEARAAIAQAELQPVLHAAVRPLADAYVSATQARSVAGVRRALDVGKSTRQVRAGVKTRLGEVTAAFAEDIAALTGKKVSRFMVGAVRDDLKLFADTVVNGASDTVAAAREELQAAGPGRRQQVLGRLREDLESLASGKVLTEAFAAAFGAEDSFADDMAAALLEANWPANAVERDPDEVDAERLAIGRQLYQSLRMKLQISPPDRLSIQHARAGGIGGQDFPRVRIRPDGWPEMLDPDTMQWLAGDEIDLPEDDEDVPPPAVRMSVQHAPAGYTKESPLRIGGKEFTGGEFIPDDVLARATPEEKAQLAGKPDTQEKRRQQGRERRARKRAEKEEAQRQKLQSAPMVANRDLTAEPAREFLDKFFPGQKLSVDDVPSLVGAPGGAEVHVYTGTYGGESISIGIYHPYVQQCSRMLHLDRDGKLIMHNTMFFLKKAHRGSGLGLQVFSEEVRKCAELGVDRIETIAGKGGIMNGYYTWARLGYDSPLEERFQKRLPENLRGASTVQDLMATPEGREYWKAKGYMTGMQFDLAPGSRSLQVLNAYLVSKNKQPIAVSPEQMEKVQKARQTKAARDAEEREKSRRRYEAALNTLNVEWKAVAENDGLDRERFLARASDWESRMLFYQTNHPADISGATDPANIRDNAYRNAHLDLLMDRHRTRMRSDEPAYVQTRKHYERLAKQEGIDLKRLRELVLQTPNRSPDGVYALGAAYRRCIKELREE